MPREAVITKPILERLMRQGLSTQEMAEVLGVHENSVSNAKRRLGMAPRRFSHKEAIPWKTTIAERKTQVYKNMLILSRVAQGGVVPTDQLRRAKDWAEGMIARGKDIAPGMDEVEADVNHWLVKRVYERAREVFLA